MVDSSPNEPTNFTETQVLDYEANLNWLLSQRQHAAQILRTQTKTELGRTPKRLEAALDSLQQCTDVKALLRSPKLLEFLPILGAIHRQDTNLLEKQTSLITEEYKQTAKWNPFVLTYGKAIFISAVCINLFINFYVYPRLAGFWPETSGNLSQPVGMTNLLAQNVTVTAIGIVAILLLWQFIVYFRDEIFVTLSKLPHVGPLFTGNKYRLKKTSMFAYTLAELLESGMPASDAVRCGGFLSSSESYVSDSIAMVINSQSSSRLVATSRINHLRTLADIYSYNSLIRHKKSELYAASGTLITGLLVYWTAVSLIAPLSQAIQALA